MLLKKKKSGTQMSYLSLVASRLDCLDSLLIQADEPMLAMRISSLLREVDMALENSEEDKNVQS